jgi:hypothetical protein
VRVPLRAAWGAVLMLAPDQLVALAGGRPDRASRMTLRVLGARHVLQAAALWRWPQPAVRRLGVAVDLLHGGTSAALAVADRRRRRVAAADAVVALLWAASGVPAGRGR